MVGWQPIVVVLMGYAIAPPILRGRCGVVMLFLYVAWMGGNPSLLWCVDGLRYRSTHPTGWCGVVMLFLYVAWMGDNPSLMWCVDGLCYRSTHPTGRVWGGNVVLIIRRRMGDNPSC